MVKVISVLPLLENCYSTKFFPAPYNFVMPQNVKNAICYGQEPKCGALINQQVFADPAKPLIYYTKAPMYVYSKQMPQKQRHAKVQWYEYDYVQCSSIVVHLCPIIIQPQCVRCDWMINLRLQGYEAQQRHQALSNSRRDCCPRDLRFAVYFRR